MNLLEAYVTKIISNEPIFKFDKYWIKVEYECWGLKSTTELMFDTEDKARDIKIGYKFLC